MARLSVKRLEQRESTVSWLSKEIKLLLAALALVVAMTLVWLELGLL